MIIKEIKARSIFDSRNEKTIEVLVNGCKASAPAGKSTGKYESPPYFNSIDWNISAINSIKIPLSVISFKDLIKIESFIAGKFKLREAIEFGANSLFALESAILKALAKHKKKQLWQILNPNLSSPIMPIPLGNVVGGGEHSHSKGHPTFQEFIIIPKGRSIKQNIEIMKSAYNKIGKMLKSNSVNDEGAWETSLNEEEILDILSKFKKKVNIGLDIAASAFYKDKLYAYNEISLSKAEQIKYINTLIKSYNLYYVEDPLQEEDFRGFSKIIRDLNHLIAGDDLTATHINRVKKAVKSNSINAMIIKPNQNGSLLEVSKIFEICRKNNIKTIISHRSGETLDHALADYAVGFQADFVKCGIATKWREVKLNRLLKIEEYMAKNK